MRGIDEVDLAGHGQLLHGHLDELAGQNLRLHAHARHEGHADLRLDEFLDGLDGGHLDVHVERDAVALEGVQHERLVLGAQAMGEALEAIAITLEHVRARQAFGGALWDRQAVRQRLSGLSARVAAARHMRHNVACMVDAGVDCVKEVSMVNALCGELVNEVMYDCVQFHGGMGLMRGHPIERMARDARVHAIGGGATEVMLEEVAKRL